MRVLLACLVGAVIILMILHRRKEGFQSKESVEDALSTDEFAFELVQAVKGPIKRLSSVLLDIPTWKERFTLATMNPVELARHQLRKQDT